MAATSCRRLHDLFAARPSRSRLNDLLRPSASAASTPQKPADLSLSSGDSNRTALFVKKFKEACHRKRFRSRYKDYETAVLRLATSNQFSYIEEILELQKKFYSITDEGFVVRLIRLYGKAGMLDHACKLFDEMPQLKCDRTVFSFNALLAACVASKNYDKMNEFFRELPGKLSIEPNTISYNTVIKALCQTGSLHSALSLIEELEEKGLEPDVVTFNTLLHAFYSNDRFSEAEKLWDVMERKNVAPNVRSYNPKLRALIALNRVSEAAELLKEMDKEGVKPDMFSYNAVIRGYVGEGNLAEAKKLCSEMEQQNLYPDGMTLSVLIPFVCDKLDSEFAAELGKKAVHKRRLVDKDIMQRVVDALVNDSNVEEAKKLVDLGKSSPFDYELKLPKT